MRSGKLKIYPTVISINISSGGIPKRLVESVFVSRAGLAGDGHNHEKHNTPLQAVSLQDMERLEELKIYARVTKEGILRKDDTIQIKPPMIQEAPAHIEFMR